MRLYVRVPASTSNLGPGFDCLGLALDLYLQIEAEVATSGLVIEVDGEQAATVPRDAGNLVHAALDRELRRAGRSLPGLHLRIHNDIPLGRGLGSSAAAALAGLVAGAILARDGEAPDATSVLHAGAEIEGHPDNVVPALLGGLTASAMSDGRVATTRLPFPESLAILLVIPDREVPTEAARRLLPEMVPRADAVFNCAHVALLLGALHNEDFGAVRDALRDRLHQDLRLGLVPGLAEALRRLDAEPHCVGAALSGSGPTLLGLFAPGASADAGTASVAALAAHGIGAVRRWVRPDRHGLWWDIRTRQST